MSVYQEMHYETRRMRWRVDVKWRYPDGTTKRIRKISPINTKRGAEQYERDVRNALADGTYGKRKVDGDVETLATFAERYFRDHVAKLKPTTQSAQETIWRVSLLPALGDVPLERIDSAALDRLMRALRERGLSAKSTNNALSALRTALTRAEDWKLIGAVPRVHWLKVPQQSFDFFSFEEASKLIQLGGSPMLVVALKTGMRIGELLALKWADVSFERKLVTVARSVSWLKGRAHEGATKTGKVRTVSLVTQALAALAAVQPDVRKRKGYVFTDAQGRQLTRNACRRPLWAAQDAAGLRRTGWHVCRHTFASHLVMKGAPLATVQYLMGHTTIAMTMKYAHLAPDHLRSAMGVLEEDLVTITAEPSDD